MPMINWATAYLNYYEQLGYNWATNSTAIGYNVTAIQQVDNSTTGPAYLVQGVTDKDYWFQTGLAYNWGGGLRGFSFISTYFYPNGTVFTQNNTFQDDFNFSGTVNPGDIVLVDAYIDTSRNLVVIYAKDWNTGAYASSSYSAFGAHTFLGYKTSLNTNGKFTGIMTEWWHIYPYFGDEEQVLYSPYGWGSPTGKLFIDEGNVTVYGKPTALFANTLNVTSGTQIFELSSHGATIIKYANNTIATGTLNPITTYTTSSVSSSTTISINTTTIPQQNTTTIANGISCGAGTTLITRSNGTQFCQLSCSNGSTLITYPNSTQYCQPNTSSILNYNSSQNGSNSNSENSLLLPIVIVIAIIVVVYYLKSRE